MQTQRRKPPMRDPDLLCFTLRAIRDLGDNSARVVQDDAGRGLFWYAGPQPLNSQALQDLVGDGWLRLSADKREVHVAAWPSFATTTPLHAPHKRL